MIEVRPQPVTESDELIARTAIVQSSDAALHARVFFAVPDRLGDLVTTRDDFTLPLAAMLGLTRGEDVDFGGVTVDPLLLRNTRAAIRQFHAWYPALRVPELANLAPAAPSATPAPGAAAFLSGGIDSLFTLQRHSEGRSADPESTLDREPCLALHLYHTDRSAPLTAAESLTALARTAESAGVSFVPVFTNAMTFDGSLHDRWADVGHGAGLATVLHLLSGGIGAGLIGSTHSYGGLMPWGSSPVTDPLWSGSLMQVIHDGSTFTQVEKTATIAANPALLASINVCDTRVPGQGYVNCSQCQKCLRTMVTLDLLGHAGEVPAFDWTDYAPGRFARVYLRNANEAAFAREIQDAAVSRRPDIAAACDAALSRERRLPPPLCDRAVAEGQRARTPSPRKPQARARPALPDLRLGQKALATGGRQTQFGQPPGLPRGQRVDLGHGRL